jgi:hypothetical protein
MIVASINLLSTSTNPIIATRAEYDRVILHFAWMILSDEKEREKHDVKKGYSYPHYAVFSTPTWKTIAATA